jgi:hypothetical protein
LWGSHQSRSHLLGLFEVSAVSVFLPSASFLCCFLETPTVFLMTQQIFFCTCSIHFFFVGSLRMALRSRCGYEGDSQCDCVICQELDFGLDTELLQKKKKQRVSFSRTKTISSSESTDVRKTCYPMTKTDTSSK